MFDLESGDLIRKILSNEPTGPGGETASLGFGNSVDLEGGVLAVGLYKTLDFGEPYPGPFFLYNATNGEVLHRFEPPGRGVVYFSYGRSVSMGDGIVAVSGKNGAAGFPSSVYVYDTNTGEQLGELIPDDWESTDSYGVSFAIGDGVIAVGAPRDDDYGSSSGSVYQFDAQTLALIQKSHAIDAGEGDHFGSQIAIDDGVMVVTAPRVVNDSVRATKGVAYAIDLATGDEIGKFVHANSSDGETLGESIAFHQGVIASMASQSFPGLVNSVSVFTLPDSVCTADLSGDGVLDFFDISAFLKAYGAEDSVADFSGDGVFDFFDISAFLTAYSAGCP